MGVGLACAVVGECRQSAWLVRPPEERRSRRARRNTCCQALKAEAVARTDVAAQFPVTKANGSCELFSSYARKIAYQLAYRNFNYQNLTARIRARAALEQERVGASTMSSLRVHAPPASPPRRLERGGCLGKCSSGAALTERSH